MLVAGAKQEDIAGELGITSRTLRNWMKLPAYRIAMAEAGAIVRGAAYNAFSNRMIALAERVANRYEEMVGERFNELPGQVQAKILRDVADWLERGNEAVKVNNTLNVNQTIDWTDGAPPPIGADVIEVDVADG